MDRRKFLIGAGLGLIAASSPISLSAIGQATKRVTKTGRMKLSYMPYELQLRHAFNLAKYSRTTTPDVQVQIELDGIVGYGEASMPPYLGESVESVCKFLSQVDLSQFSDPFRMEEILDYVDGIAPNNRAAKASIDIALHDLLGKIMGQPWYKIWGLSPEKAPNTSFTIGIDKADQDKLFKSFSQVDASVSRKYGGTGLGLNISKQLVTLMGGSINVESEKNKGTNFTFSRRMKWIPFRWSWMTRLRASSRQRRKRKIHFTYLAQKITVMS